MGAYLILSKPLQGLYYDLNVSEMKLKLQNIKWLCPE